MINIDTTNLNTTTKQLKELIENKDYKKAIDLVTKEQNKVYKMNYKTRKALSGKKDISRYLLNKELATNKEKLEEFKKLKSLIRKSAKSPKAIRFNSALARFDVIQKKQQARKQNIKSAKSYRNLFQSMQANLFDLFLTRGFLDNPNFEKIIDDVPILADIIKKYFGDDFIERLKSRMRNVSPVTMSGDVADEVFSLSNEYISKFKNIEPQNEQETQEILRAMDILNRILEG